MAVTLMTVAEYARHRGCDEKAVRKALAEERISRVGTDRRCIHPAVADSDWAANTRARGDSARHAAAAPGGQGAAAPEPATGYDSHRARREKAEADQAELRASRAAQEVLLREPAERAIFEAFRGLRDAAFQAMRDVAPKVRDLTETREIQLALEDELRQAFASFETSTRKRLADLAEEVRK